MVDVLKRGAAHESLVCTSAYILGEFGKSIVGVGGLYQAAWCVYDVLSKLPAGGGRTYCSE